MVERARSLAPRLHERAAEAEMLGHLPEQTIRDLRDGGFFRVLQPKRFGGYELDYGRTQVELCDALGRACGSTSWVQCGAACHALCVAMFPETAHQAVWSPAPATLLA